MTTTKTIKQVAPKSMWVVEQGVHVMVVYVGMQCKYAWPRDAMTTQEVAQKLIANWYK